ncbi:MAG: ATP-dependent helicase [Erysipelotrichia bacterium]|jgi:DNA helicase-2/ATP-dependent DNA helicase PcrA|nr:ATP-dependent helicase [Erysipelotrichia bacterium]
MADAAIEKSENIFLVNAPAGSGKTTKIKAMLSEIIASNPNDNILCITYTNRAAEELAKGMDNNKIFFGTIHAYIHSLISPFFKHQQIIDLYWEIYGGLIRERIANTLHDENIAASNQKYIDKYGELIEETIKHNLSKISYNETSFNSLFYGGLGHDDLITFAKTMFDRYPAMRKKIINKYSYIFIDEYQDTSGCVLKLFYDAVRNTKVQLYLLGDRMQQIYKNYDGSFEEELMTLNNSISLDINHRSIKAIIDILNNIYNNPDYKQDVSKNNIGKEPNYLPEVIITNDIDGVVEKNQTEHKDTLVLYLLNNDKFKEIGASTLYRAFSRMDKYSFPKKYHSNDVLSNNTQENPDPLMRFLFSFDSVMTLYQDKNFGSMINQCKLYKEFYSTNTYSITKHDDKKRLSAIYEELSKVYFDNDSIISIEHLLKDLVGKDIITEAFMQGLIDDGEYQEVLNVEVAEVRRLAAYLKEPRISTQHGVKGESHTSVLFVAADSHSTPIVHMYNFFRVWSYVDFSLTQIEEFYYKYAKLVINTEKKLGMQTKDLTADSHNKNEANKLILIQASQNMLDTFKTNELFELLCKGYYEEYLQKPNVGNAKKCFKDSTVYGVLVAYKLFYVGCSRARKNLTVVVDENKISDFTDAFKEKLKKIGFKVK